MKRKVGIYLIANIYGGLLSLIVIPIMSRALSPADFGRAVVFVTMVWILNTTISLNLSATYAADRTTRPHEELVEYVTSGVRLAFANSIAAFALINLFQSFAEGMFGLSIDILNLAIVGSFFNIFFLLLQSHQMVTGGTRRYAVQQIANATLVGVLTVVLLLPGKMGLSGRVYALFIPYVLFGLFAIAFLARHGLIRATIARARYREVISAGMRLMPHMGGVFLFAALDRFIVADIAGADVAGIYLSAVSLTAVASFLISAINRAAVPILYDAMKNDRALARRFMRRFIPRTLAGGVVAVIATVLVLPMTTWFLGDRYSEAELVLPWLIIAQVFFAIYTVGANVFLFERRNLTLSTITITAGSLTVLLMYVLYPILGIAGFGVAQAIGYAARAAATIAIADRLVAGNGSN